MQDIYLIIFSIISFIIAIISLYISFKIYKKYEKTMSKLGEGKDFSEMLSKYIEQVNKLNERDDQIIEVCNNINKELRVESHILDFSKMIYGKKITIVLLKYIRDNIKVNSIDEVKKLLENDEKKIRKYFKRRTKQCLSLQTKKQK